MNSVCTLAYLLISAVSVMSSYDPDIGISFEDMVKSRGFRVETYQVTTEDGYILTVQRIINPTVPNRSKLKPVVLQHGILETGIDFIVSSPFLYSKQSSALNATTIDLDENDYLGDNLGFDLSLTRRYDVWVANSRGVMRTANQHVNLSITDSKFWAYSWDEQGLFDLPAVIDFVLTSTNRSSLGYIGYSQGTTSLYVLLSMRPEYANKIEPAISLAPVAYLEHMSSPIRFLDPEQLGFCSHDAQLVMSQEIVDKLLAWLCPIDVPGLICQNILFAITGFDYENLNKTRVPVYYSNVPAPVSNRQICHYYKIYKARNFARYDFGLAEINQDHYNQPTPPDYPLDRVGNLTMAFFIGKNDFFSNFPDLDKLRDGLSKSRATLLPNFVIDEPHWSHLSFVYGIDAGIQVYKDVIDVLDQYSLDH